MNSKTTTATETTGTVTLEKQQPKKQSQWHQQRTKKKKPEKPPQKNNTSSNSNGEGPSEFIRKKLLCLWQTYAFRTDRRSVWNTKKNETKKTTPTERRTIKDRQNEPVLVAGAVGPPAEIAAPTGVSSSPPAGHGRPRPPPRSCGVNPNIHRNSWCCGNTTCAEGRHRRGRDRGGFAKGSWAEDW